MAGPGSRRIGREELREVLDVMESGSLFRYGSLDDPAFKHKVYTLEREFAARCGVRHALALSSGSGALIAALKAIGLQAGDEVIVPAYTFVATFSSVIHAGGVPVLAEIDESLNLDPAEIGRRLTPRTRAVMPVHMLGNPCDMAAIMAEAGKHSLRVVEDACQANGAAYRGRPVGTIGEIGAFARASRSAGASSWASPAAWPSTCAVSCARAHPTWTWWSARTPTAACPSTWSARWPARWCSIPSSIRTRPTKASTLRAPAAAG